MSENKGIIFRQLLPPYEKYKSSGPRLHKAETRMVIDCMDITHGSQHQIGVLIHRCKDCGKAIPLKNNLCCDCEKARRFPQEEKDKTLKVIEQSFQQ